MPSAPEKPVPEIPLGVFLQGEPITDPDFKGQHPLFYGTVHGLPGFRREPHAFIKLLPAEQLFAETISASIGRHFGLPIPLTALVLARGEAVGRGSGKCIALASIDGGARPIGRLTNTEGALQKLNAWASRHAAAVFDELIANQDRNLRNLLLGSDGEIWLIDHEEALAAPAAHAGLAIRNHLLGLLASELSEFERHQAARKLKESAGGLYSANFRKHAQLSQPEYCQVSAGHVSQVVEFLETRIHHMSSLLDQGTGLRQKSMAI
ncbi:hypothetical protein FQZ97_798690 [compost metagenome]